MNKGINAVANDLVDYDEAALIEQLGIRAKMLQQDPSFAGDLAPELNYDAKFLGPLDSAKALGLKILDRWNKELFEITCGSSSDDKEDRTKILNALTLGEGAAIAALIPVLAGLGLAPTLAAVLAAIIVKRFFGSAVETICESWKQQLSKSN